MVRCYFHRFWDYLLDRKFARLYLHERLRDCSSSLSALYHYWPYGEWIGKEEVNFLGFSIAGVACLLFETLSSLHIALRYVCLVLGTFGTICAFNLVYIVTAEIFPTAFRGSIFGLSNVVGRVGGILAPLIDGVAKGSFMYIFGAVGLLSAFLSLFLKETKGEVMADTKD